MSHPVNEHHGDTAHHSIVDIELSFTEYGYHWWCTRAAGVRQGEHVSVIVSLRQLLEHVDVMHHGDLLRVHIDARTQADLAWALDLRLLTPGRSRV